MAAITGGASGLTLAPGEAFRDAARQCARKLAIDKVGIKAIRHPIQIMQRVGGVQHTIFKIRWDGWLDDTRIFTVPALMPSTCAVCTSVRSSK